MDCFLKNITGNRKGMFTNKFFLISQRDGTEIGPRFASQRATYLEVSIHHMAPTLIRFGNAEKTMPISIIDIL
jgi:hypothetical protein